MKNLVVGIISFMSLVSFAHATTEIERAEAELTRQGYRLSWHCEDGDGDDWAYFDLYMRPGGRAQLLTVFTDANTDTATLLANEVVTYTRTHEVNQPLEIVSPTTRLLLGARFMGASGKVDVEGAVVSSTFRQISGSRNLGEYSLTCMEGPRN